MKILVDSNVIIDAVSSRRESNEASKKLFLLASSYEVEGCLIAKQITDIHCCLRKYISEEAKRREFISFLLEVFRILPLGKEDLQRALDLGMKDYGDAVLVSSSSSDIDCIVTNNPKDFISSPLKALTPQEALKKLQEQNA